MRFIYEALSIGLLLRWIGWTILFNDASCYRILV